MIQDERRDRGNIVEFEDRNGSLGNRAVARDRYDVTVARVEQRLADCPAEHLQLWERLRLEPFDQDQIHGREAWQQFIQGRLRRVPVLMHQGPAMLRGDQHLGRAGLPMNI
jgi:hypothetical protein